MAKKRRLLFAALCMLGCLLIYNYWVKVRYDYVRSMCVELKEPEWDKHVEPLIKLRPDKLLYPAVIWGPNNEVDGFIQTMYLAIQLNRTLVIPAMSTDQKHDWSYMLPSYKRIDVERVRRFVSTVSIDQMRTQCDGWFDVAFMSHQPEFVEFRRLQSFTGMKVFKRRTKSESILVLDSYYRLTTSIEGSFIPAYPTPPIIPQLHPYISPRNRDLRRIFPSQANCAVHLSPFEAIKVKQKDGSANPLENKFTKANVNVSLIPTDVLYSACTDAIQHPPVISQIATSFLEQFSSDKLTIFLHWRYDKNDWVRTNCKNPQVDPHELCLQIKDVTTEDVFNGFIKKLIVHLSSKYQKSLHDIGLLYISTPNSMKSFAEKFRSLTALKIPNCRIVTNPDLKVYVQKRWQFCLESWISQVEFYSLVELELSRLCNIFFYSPFSTWSTYSMLRRNKTSSNYSMISVTEAAIDAHKERILTLE